MRHLINPVRCGRCPTRAIAALAGMCLLAGYPCAARAGDMDALGAVYIAFFVVVGLAIVGGAIALRQCRHIDNRRLRALVRFVIVVLLFTPIPLQQGDGSTQFMLAFLFVTSSTLTGATTSHLRGPFHYPVLLAYGVVLLLGIPLVMAWVGIGERHRRRSADP